MQFARHSPPPPSHPWHISNAALRRFISLVEELSELMEPRQQLIMRVHFVLEVNEELDTHFFIIHDERNIPKHSERCLKPQQNNGLVFVRTKNDYVHKRSRGDMTR